MSDSSNQKRQSRYRSGTANGNWRGGRSVASNGYVLVRVGIGHHLADVRGYAYEHRLVAEKKIGRRLKLGEEVHHVNSNKSDNRPENLEVTASAAVHHALHRKHERGLRMPGEPNPIITCACGCGDRFYKFDETGRPRLFTSGHNPHPAPSKTAIVEALKHGATRRAEIAQHVGCSPKLVSVQLYKMSRQHLVRRTEDGCWILTSERLFVAGLEVSR